MMGRMFRRALRDGEPNRTRADPNSQPHLIQLRPPIFDFWWPERHRGYDIEIVGFKFCPWQ